MDNKESSSSNWLTLLRRKIQKKFKRNRQKLENSSSLDDIIDEEEPEIPAQPEEENPTATSASNQLGNLTAQDCDQMKKELFKLSWYWPKLSRLESQKLLSNEPNGSFLIRDSSQNDSFTLSFRTNSKTFHCRNQWWVMKLHHPRWFIIKISPLQLRSQILASDSSSHSLIDVIEETIKKSQSSVVGFVKCDNNDVSFPSAYPVRLVYPICRNLSVPTLQSICLSKIKSKVNSCHINSLPLPPRIKEYVRLHYSTL